MTGEGRGGGDSRSGPASAPHITIRGLTKRFQGAAVYEKFDLDIPRGRFVSIFGPNGCGKSTLINMIAGLIPVDSGQILFSGKRIGEIKFGYVFQNYREALFPWLRALDNIEYPLKVMGLSRAEREACVERLVAHLGVKLDLARYPYELSGGQQQLISILRALVVEPEVLFLDEPFSALDAQTRTLMMDELLAIWERTRQSILYVTHNIQEAVFMADRVIVLSRRPGEVLDVVPIKLGRPRRESQQTEAVFVQAADRIWGMIKSQAQAALLEGEALSERGV